MASHNLWLRLNFPKKDIESPQVICIWYKGIFGKKQRKTNFKVAPIHWDSKAKRIKPKYLELYPDVQEGLDTIVKAFTKQYELLNKGEVVIDTVFDNLTFKRDLKGSLREFLINTSRYSETTRKNYLDRLSGIEKHYGRTLFIGQLGDRTEIFKIKKKLEESSLGNGAADYMRMLRTLSRNFDFDTNKIYKDSIPSETETYFKAFSSADMKRAINRIQTVGQLEAFLFWLYSFCLKAMTGMDIPNLDEDSLEFENPDIPLTHYHQFGMYIKSEDRSRPSFSSKVHYKKNRGKSGVMLGGLYNLFPTLFVKDWLRYCINIAHPQYAYKGEDSIRLFNFKTKDQKSKPIEASKIKWKKIRDTYRDIYVKLFDGSLHQTRHTYEGCMERLGLTSFEQKRQLGHKVDKDALKNYAGAEGVKVNEDLNQLGVIELFDISGIVKMLSKKFIRAKDMYERPYANAQIGVEFALVSQIININFNDIGWNSNDEHIYQKLLEDAKFKGVIFYNVETGYDEIKEPSEEDFEGRLLLMHNRRKEFTGSVEWSLGNPSNKDGVKFIIKTPEWAKEKLKDGIKVKSDTKEKSEKKMI